MSRALRFLGLHRSLRAVVAILAAAAPALGASPELILEGPHGPIDALEVGHDLHARVAGLEAGGGYVYRFIVLVDEDEIDLPPPAVADGTSLLWGGTGIVGCDCRAQTGNFRFARFEEATAKLTGRELRVEIRASPEGDTTGTEEVMAAVSLPIVETSRPVAFTADATGCPRFLFANDEDIFLEVRGGAVGELVHTHLLPAVAGSPEPWDIRGDAGGDAVYELTPPHTQVVQWHGLLSELGEFTAGAISTRWPFNLPMLKDGGINSGLVVHDHSCPLPPPHWN